MGTMIVTEPVDEAAVLRFIRQAVSAGHQVQVQATEPFVTHQRAADLLGASRSFVMKKVRSGEIASTRDGTRHRISVAEVERFRRARLHGAVEDCRDQIDADLGS